MRTKLKQIAAFLLFTNVLVISAQTDYSKTKVDSLKNIALTGLKFRSIGPAITGGRIRDLAVNPYNHSEYFVGSGHGCLWKTTNNGITFSPTFDNQNSYAIGAVEIDPSNPNIVWVGTGESSNQYNSGYGDGVYKSEDGGKSWKNMGLTNSEHIGGIAIDPNNSNVVFVAAMGSLRREGGDRGIFKTTDGGKTWENVLRVSDYTGCYQVHIDQRYPNILYAVAHQRMRKLFTNISGGPESGIYRTLDGGVNWEKLTNGLPSEHIGRTGMAISPVNPDVLYAIVEAKEAKGIYKSVDRGASWTKQSSYISSYPFYFQRLFCDVVDVDRLYSMDVFLQVSKDGGKTWSNLGEEFKHVDNHALWIDPSDNKHIISGCDGGVYETYDQGKNWDFKSNIPIAEIYKVSTDNALPFYNIYIGTQDNNSLFSPSKTISSAGITNNDWIFSLAGDGFETQVDWKDPNIVYSQWQNGGLTRYDKMSGERLFIKPYDFADTAYRFDWDAALFLSRHDNKRLYFGGNKILRSDDQGSTWVEISPDLTRDVPKNMQRLMGRSWSIDELAAKGAMAQIVTIAESPIDENILFVGSGDGLIHFTTNGGKVWTKSTIKNLPEYARVHHIIASNHNKLVAYAACHNFSDGDYQPYLYKTTDSGKTWNVINGNLPKRGSTFTIAEDHINGDLLFVGTQFGVYFTNDGGKEWIPLKNGIPKMAVMDLEIQKRESDLVVSTFGRGVYILDDYSPLRNLSSETLQKQALIFPVKDALMFIPADPFGFKGKAFLGASFYTAPNPEVGAVFTYYLKDEFKSLKEMRRETEKEKQKKNEDVEFPSYDRLKKEAEEIESYLIFTIVDEEGNVVRKLKTNASKGVNRIVWDFRYNVFTPISLEPFDDSVPWIEPDKGYMVMPGKYNVSLGKFEGGNITELVPAQEFICKPLNNVSLPAEDKLALDNFNIMVAELTRTISGADAFRKELVKKLAYLKKAVIESADVPVEMYNNILSIELKLGELNKILNGDPLRAKYDGASPTSIKDRVDLITSALWSTTAAPTTTFIKSYDAAAAKCGELLLSLKSIDNEIESIESLLEKHGAPYTPGRFPNWRKN